MSSKNRDLKVILDYLTKIIQIIDSNNDKDLELKLQIFEGKKILLLLDIICEKEIESAFISL